jgi:tripartite-type tricarboxylate transporter receptor subunit TctC
LLVAYPAGGVSDGVARLLAERLSISLGVAVVVENRAGASGTIALDAVAKAPPDGTVLGFSASSPLTLSPHLLRLPFDPFRDLVPVASVMTSPVLLLATPACTAPDFKALLAQARVQPGRLRWATSGQASLGHIMLAQVMAQAQVDIVHVPYKGGGQQISDALGGQFEVLSVNASPSVMQHLGAGKLRALAVGSAQRLVSVPQAPTLGELGLAAANLASQFGIFAPGRTPIAVLQRIHAEVGQALASPQLRQFITQGENQVAEMGAPEFSARLKDESAANARIIRAAGISAE